MKKINGKKILIVTAIVVAVLLVGGVMFGVLNALVADGAWEFGWSDYRYDETDYEIGEGSIVATELTKIEVDWVDGEVEIVPCQDTYLSITEEADGELPESAKVRWCVSDDEKTLSIKYRKSSWFFAVGTGNRQKRLTVRVPERFFEQMTELDVEADSANISVKGISAASLELSAKSGAVNVENCTFSKTEIETKSGNVALRADANASFVLNWETKHGKLSSDFAFVQDGTRYTVGNGGNTVSVKTESGDLLLSRKD